MDLTIAGQAGEIPIVKIHGSGIIGKPFISEFELSLL